MPVIHKYNNTAYIKVSELTPIEQEVLHRVMVGSTCPAIPGNDALGCIYAHDYTRIEVHIKQRTRLYIEAENALLSRGVQVNLAKRDSLGL